MSMKIENKQQLIDQLAEQWVNLMVMQVRHQRSVAKPKANKKTKNKYE